MLQRQSCLTSTGKENILLGFLQCCHTHWDFAELHWEKVTQTVTLELIDSKINAYIELDLPPALQSGSGFRFTLIRDFGVLNAVFESLAEGLGIIVATF